jgi:hypothetical protein
VTMYIAGTRLQRSGLQWKMLHDVSIQLIEYSKDSLGVSRSYRIGLAIVTLDILIP